MSQCACSLVVYDRIRTDTYNMEAENIAENLRNSLANDKGIRQNAENSLQTARKSEKYTIHLVNLIEKSSQSIVKLAASIELKNAVKMNTKVVNRRHISCFRTKKPISCLFFFLGGAFSRNIAPNGKIHSSRPKAAIRNHQHCCWSRYWKELGSFGEINHKRQHVKVVHTFPWTSWSTKSSK